ncbi:MFS-type transporter SLC18B1 isoform X1 [Diabrotica virgifera virgifera]|uniref:MFS-type transporter SLC18B1-like isoform X1 n=1 Tax=Diabrotica virgifera virgifera TaxID=50390 RepID=A0A6P7FDF9_DIAVI|nr:MFS-type transporter SLC18B1 isoform X1 [Diabrotica virgifera virgifera]
MEADENKNIPSVSQVVDENARASDVTTVKVDDEKQANKQEIKGKKITWKQKCSLVMLMTADFMCYCSMSIMAPFYPQEAANRGMTQSMAGFVFGYFALVIFISSPIFGKICPKIGVKFLFIIGLFTSGICTVIFGTLHHVEDYGGFTTLSFVIRGFAALGSSAYATAAYVIVVNVFPDNAGAIRGILETFVGLGLCAGPGIGGVLFDIGGFGLPFYVVGIILVILAPLNLFILEKPQKTKIESKSGSLTSLLKLTPIMMTCFIMIVVSMTWGFLDPTLEPHFSKFSLSNTVIGLIFLLTSGTYAISCPFWGYLTDKLQVYWWLMTVGLFGNSVILLFLGPCFSFLPESLWLNMLSLSLLGVTVGMALMPTYQFILDSALENGYADDLATHSVIAGLWSSVYSLGEVLGPVLGGSLMEHYEFSNACATFAALNFFVGALTTVFLMNRKELSLKGNLLSVFIKPEIYQNGTIDIIVEKEQQKMIENIKTK